MRTSDADTIAEALNRIATHRARVTIDDPGRVDLRLSSGEQGGMSTFRLRLGGISYAAVNEPLDFLLAGFVAKGQARVRVRTEEHTLADGNAWLFPIGVPYSGEYGHTALCLVRVPFVRVAEVAEAAAGVDLRFESSRPVSAAMGRYWNATAAFLSAQLVRDDLPPLVLGQMTHLAATVMLATFPNTTMTGRAAGGGEVAPAVVRRAAAFIDGNPERPLTVADVAAAAGIGERALQLAFRRHLDTTPMAYLRRARLARVHHALQTADPATGATVAAIARRWGFANQSRFATDYRAAYGRTPSRTLRT